MSGRKERKYPFLTFFGAEEVHFLLHLTFDLSDFFFGRQAIPDVFCFGS